MVRLRLSKPVLRIEMIAMLPLTALMQKHYSVYNASKQECWFQFAASRVVGALERENWLLAQTFVMEWACGIGDWLGLGSVDNWKFFKRSIAAKWFGKVKNRRFSEQWIRCSSFPPNIACHATSIQLSPDCRETWRYNISELDRSIPIEVFPQACRNDTLCLRRYSTLFGENVVYEMGKGQPMHVFEQQRGKHPIVSAQNGSGVYVYTRVACKNQKSLGDRLEMSLAKTIEMRDADLSSKSFSLCRSLGIDYLSIEGCHEFGRPDLLKVVDVDLPFDFVFMPSSK